MDLAFQLFQILSWCCYLDVSILVLMDLAFQHFILGICKAVPRVSILVLMDLAFQHVYNTIDRRMDWGFNPCFNGSCFSTRMIAGVVIIITMFQSLF